MSLSAPLVLLLTHSGDYFTIDRVAAALEARGATALRFDTDSFPSNLRIAIEPGQPSRRYLFEAGGSANSERHWWNLEDVSAVWSRRVWDSKLSPELDEQFREGCIRESGAALRGFLGGLQQAHWVNPQRADQRAADKLLQLEIAAALEIPIPKTLVTNDPASVRRFVDETNGPVITKMLTPLTVSMGQPELFVRTSRIEVEDLEHLQGLAHSPMMFQEEISKDVELRVVHVAGEFYVGQVDASCSARGATDWRAASTSEVQWKRGSLPDTLAAQLRALMSELGLIYGAIDLIRQPAGDHVFLEVNPCGEWGMLERDLDLDISGALARALLSATKENSAR